jgi:RimJ/RimL family protein N-acetyltransferase
LPRLLPPVLPPGTLGSQAQPTLHTPAGATVRPWAPSDVPVLVAAYEDPAIRFWHHRSMDHEEAGTWVASAAERWAAETDAEWAVSDGGHVLGRVALRGIDLAVGQAEVSYWTLPRGRGRGLATAAVDRVASWALDDVGFWRLEIRHATRNVASCRVAERAGFPGEAQLDRQHLHEDGWHDVHLHRRFRAGHDPGRTRGGPTG